MLVLARRTNERIFITCPDGTVLTITVTDIVPKDRKVRIGFDAPRNYDIKREEIMNPPIPPRFTKDGDTAGGEATNVRPPM